MIVYLFKILLMKINLIGIGCIMDSILCGMVFICLLLDAMIDFIILSILIKIITKRSITYWIRRII